MFNVFPIFGLGINLYPIERNQEKPSHYPQGQLKARSRNWPMEDSLRAYWQLRDLSLGHLLRERELPRTLNQNSLLSWSMEQSSGSDYIMKYVCAYSCSIEECVYVWTCTPMYMGWMPGDDARYPASLRLSIETGISHRTQKPGSGQQVPVTSLSLFPRHHGYKHTDNMPGSLYGYWDFVIMSLCLHGKPSYPIMTCVLWREGK